MDELDLVLQLLGRKPKASFAVCVTDSTGRPVVIESSPHCFDGEPMPTRFWLIGASEIEAVGHLESQGGVHQAEQSISASDIRDVHDKYANQRDALITDSSAHKPTGGVGGTREGVKCLHAHYANWLATDHDVVGEWTHARIRDAGEEREDYVVIPIDVRKWYQEDEL